MSLLELLKTICEAEHLPVMTAELLTPEVEPPETYIVLYPIADILSEYADDKPKTECDTVRITIFTKHNYQKIRKKLRNRILSAELHIEDQQFIEKEEDTGFYHYEIEVTNIENLEE